MKELPALSGGKSTVVGTYFAEQVSDATFDLLSVSFPEQQRRPTTQQSSSGNSAPSSPGTANGRRKHVVQEQMGAKCTTLPALQAEAAAGKFSKDEEEQDNRRQVREAKKMATADRIHRCAARLYRGERCHYRRRGECATPSDEDIMRSLTRPLGCFALGPGVGAPEGMAAATPRGGSAGAFQKGRGKRHETYREAFAAGLAGTELADMPLRQRSPLVVAYDSARHRRGQDRVRLSGSVELRVLPEDPVEAFFKMEEATMQEKKAHEQAQVKGGPSRQAHLREMVKNAVYKEDGVIAQARERCSVFQLPPGSEAEAGSEVQGEGAAAGTPHGVPAAVGVADTVAVANTAAGPSPGAEATGGTESWGDIVDAVVPKAKMNPVRREACELLRKFTFGSAGNERKKGPEKDRIFQEACGTKEQVKMLHALWDKLDLETTGFVDVQDFRAFVDRTLSEVKGDRRKDGGFQLALTSNGQTEELSKRLCDRVANVLMSKKSFILEDMMRIIWPCSGVEHLKQMKAWCDEISQSSTKWRVSTPKVLPTDQLEAIQAVFHFYDKDHTGYVTADELFHEGLMDKENASRYVFDGDSDGQLSLHEFCQIMCPTGYRAKAEAEIGTNDEGQRIVYDKRLGGWRLEDDSEHGAL